MRVLSPPSDFHHLLLLQRGERKKYGGKGGLKLCFFFVASRGERRSIEGLLWGGFAAWVPSRLVGPIVGASSIDHAPWHQLGALFKSVYRRFHLEISSTTVHVAPSEFHSTVETLTNQLYLLLLSQMNWSAQEISFTIDWFSPALLIWWEQTLSNRLLNAVKCDLNCVGDLNSNSFSNSPYGSSTNCSSPT